MCRLGKYIKLPLVISKAQRLEKQLRCLFTRLCNVSTILMSTIPSPPVYQSSSLCYKSLS